jgi:zinc-ribbon domain
MTGLMQRIFRRRASGPRRRGAAGLALRLPAGLRRRRSRGGAPWGKRAAQPVTPGTAAAEVVETAGTASFRDRGRLRRRLRFLRRARELAFRDVGGLIFDMRRFDRERPDLVEAKLAALAAVDQELRALERALDDRRPIHELREPGLSSCPRCGALHASEDNFCPRCGLQFGGPQAMGEVGGAVAAPPRAPLPPADQAAAATRIAPGTAGARPAGRSSADPAGGPAGASGGRRAGPTHPADPRHTEIQRPPDAS